MRPRTDEYDDESATLARTAVDPETERRAYLVSVVDGPDRGLTLLVDPGEQGRVFVGQSPACALRLTDKSVSRRHLALEFVDSRLKVSDLESTNGTLANDLSLGEVFVTEFASFRLGGSAIEVRRVASSTQSRAPLSDRFGKLLGSSPAMRRVYPLCERLAASELSMILEGETGTGKEVLAESIHERSARKAGPYVVFDCTAVPPSLLEARLFGYERGSFTGATQSHRGVFERAHGGTLFIDEIGDLDIALQAKLLRAVERGEIERIGGEQSIQVDVRILAATRRDLDREIQAGRFRDDLFHRLAAARVELPPLRNRREDIPLLVSAFLAELGAEKGAVPTELMRRWRESAWPGNVRELRNAVKRHLALGDLSRAGTEPFEVDLSGAGEPASSTDDEWIDRVIDPNLPLPKARQAVIDAFERKYVQLLLDRHGGNVTRAAEAAGVAKRYFQLVKARIGGKG